MLEHRRRPKREQYMIEIITYHPAPGGSILAIFRIDDAECPHFQYGMDSSNCYAWKQYAASIPGTTTAL